MPVENTTILSHVWVLLFAPAVFAFVVGGGFWAFASTSTKTPTEAGNRFKIYTWLLFPAATAGYALFLVTTQDALALADLISFSEVSFGAVIVGVVVGGGVALVTRQLMFFGLSNQSPEEILAHLTTEKRELVGLVLVAPVGEELIFRGFGAAALAPMPVWAAALVTSIAFALIHFKPVLIVFSFCVGLVFFVLYEITGSLWAPITAHAVANLGSWIIMRKRAQAFAAEFDV